MRDQLLESARRYCQQQGINEDTISVDPAGTNIYCYFGDVVRDGFRVTIDVFTIDDSLSSMIVHSGKNSAGKSFYVETREQEALHAFLYEQSVFNNHMDEMVERLERLFG